MSAHGQAIPAREDVLAMAQRPVPPAARLAALCVTGIGALVFVAYLFIDPDRAWRAFHYNWYYFATISAAGVTWAAVQRITTARWSRPVVRLMEGFVAFLPVAFVFMLLILFVGRPHIFPWTHTPPPNPERALYLNPTFLVLRDVVLFAVIMGLGLWFVYNSLRLDVGVIPEHGAAWARGLRERMRRGFGDERRELHSTHSKNGYIAVFMVLFYAYGLSVLVWDFSLTLDMHFQSTLFGWWSFMTAWLGAILSISLITMYFRNVMRADQLIVTKHWHDLGKLSFAFTAFWGYLTFGQYLVIWYGNMPEETHYMHLRLSAPWVVITTVAVALAFLPFFGLMARSAKVYLPTFILFACSGLIGTYLQRYAEVYPSLYGMPQHAPIGIPEIGVLLFYMGTWALCYLAFMDAFPKMRIVTQTSQYRDEIQVPVDPRTMEPLPAHE